MNRVRYAAEALQDHLDKMSADFRKDCALIRDIKKDRDGNPNDEELLDAVGLGLALIKFRKHYETMVVLYEQASRTGHAYAQKDLADKAAQNKS